MLFENLINFKFTHNACKNKLIQYCYAKNMNFKEFDDNKFISNMPAHEEDSEAHFGRLNTLDIVYHLYFARTQEKEEDKKSYLLVHCSMAIEDDKYYDPETMTVYLSKRAISLSLSDNQYLNGDYIKINQKINLEDYIPKVYRINIPYSEKKLSYVFYTNIQIQTVYEDTMIKSDYSNDELRQIYALSAEKKEKTVYVKLFGAKQEINFRLESTDSDIYYYSGSSRPVQTLSQQHLNCGNSYYYIGSYSNLVTDSNFYLEEIYGKYNVFYKNSISDSDEDSILTEGKSQYLLDSKVGSLSKTLDIVELKCDSPGYFNFHLLITYFTKTLTMYKRQVAYAPEGYFYIYPTVNEGQKHINLEVTTLLGKEVEINANNNQKESLMRKNENDLRALYSKYFGQKLINEVQENKLSALHKKEKEYELLKQKTGAIVCNGQVICNERKENESRGFSSSRKLEQIKKKYKFQPKSKGKKDSLKEGNTKYIDSSKGFSNILNSSNLEDDIIHDEYINNPTKYGDKENNIQNLIPIYKNRKNVNNENENISDNTNNNENREEKVEDKNGEKLNDNENKNNNDKKNNNSIENSNDGHKNEDNQDDILNNKSFILDLNNVIPINEKEFELTVNKRTEDMLSKTKQ